MKGHKQMNKMPGFTAEALLYQTSEHYQMVGAFEALTGAEVMPQQIGCIDKTLSVGPASITIHCCAWPPGCEFKACLPFIGCKTFNIP